MEKSWLQLGNIEFCVILMALVFLLFASLRPQKCSLRRAFFVEPLTFGRDMSTLLKGIACIFILMSHYVAIYYGTGLPNGALHYVQIYAANIALVWFMFCSGYGLTLKNQMGGVKLRDLRSRVLKVFLPLVAVCLLSILLKCVLHRNPDISLQYALGMRDEWYVWCIIYFYVIFFVASNLSYLLRIDKTLALTVLMIVYFVFAYNFFGESQAHYYRFPLAFMAGHVVAKENKGIESAVAIGAMMITFFFMEFHFLKCYVIAFAVLYLLGVADKLVVVRHGILYKIGVVSYFFYLCHQRISQPMLDSAGINDCMLWIVLTVLVAYGVNWAYKNTVVRIIK